jgi:hypothetical protein
VEGLEIVRQNLLSPMVLAFVLGAVATFVRSDLRFPEPVYQLLSIYLLFSIGLKGGASLATASLAEVALPALAGIGIGTAIPIWCYAILRRFGGFSVADSAALAAHYGSVSAVTFIAALAYAAAVGAPTEGFLPALLALMEVPAIAVALVIAQHAGPGSGRRSEVLAEVLSGKSMVLLGGGLAIGWLGGENGFARVAPFFSDPFQGVLTLFLLEMGMVAARRIVDLREVGSFLVAFAIAMPLANGVIGIALASAIGLSVGGAMVFGVLAASASYIAAPAAVRIALPEANPGYYLTASLAITFPFNLIVGLPVYFAIAERFASGGAP